MLKYSSLFAAVLIVFSLLLFSCNRGVNKESNSEKPPSNSNYDSLAAKKIETTVNELNVGVARQGAPIKVPFPIYNAEDTLEYWVVNNEPARISANLIYEEKVIWPTFFVKDGELVLVRYRVWVQVYPSFARERMIYLDKGKIVYCKERSMDLQPGDIPAYLRDKPFSACVKPEQEIREDYEDYWKKIQEFFATNKN